MGWAAFPAAAGAIVSARARLFACLMAAGLTLSGCTTTLKTVPPPTLPSPDQSVPPLPPSTLATTIVGSLEQVYRGVNQAIPAQVAIDPTCTGDILSGQVCGQVAIEHESVRLYMDDATFRAEDLVRFHADFAYRELLAPVVLKASCGNSPPDPTIRADVTFSTDLAWSGQWALVGTHPQARMELRDPCALTLLNRDAASYINSAASQALQNVATQSLAQLADQEAKFRPRLQAIWDRMHEPFPLGTTAYLLMQPSAMLASPVQGHGEVVTGDVGITAAPVVRLGPAPPPSGASHPLPALQTAAHPDGVDAAIEIRVPFASLSALVGKAVNGREFVWKVPILPDVHVRIVDARVYPSGDDIVFAFQLDGGVQGTVYIRSRIHYDCLREVVRIEWIDFDVQTRNELLHKADWLLSALLDVTMEQLLQTAVAFNLRSQFAQIDQDLRQALNTSLGADVRMAASLHPVDVIAQFSTATDLVVVVKIQGHVTVSAAPGGRVPTGREVRAFSVLFVTEDDNKDPEEAVDLVFLHDGAPQGSRRLWDGVEVGQNQAAGPYMFPVDVPAEHGVCGHDQLHFRKEPNGSETGAEWRTAIIIKAYYADGQEREILHRDFLRIGDGNPFDFLLPLCW